MDRSQNRPKRNQTVTRYTAGNKSTEQTRKRKGIRIILGVIHYLSQYIENLSTHTDILRQLQKKDSV